MKMTRIAATFAVAGIAAIAAPAALAKPTVDQNIVQAAVAAGQFKTLAKLLTRAGLVGVLQKPGPYTVLAPTDAAFAKVPKATLTALLNDRSKLRAVLLYHVIPGKLTAAKVVKLASAKTLGGKTLRIRLAGPRVLVNTARVTKTNLMASNGVIHVIDSVLIPPAH